MQTIPTPTDVDLDDPTLIAELPTAPKLPDGRNGASDRQFAYIRDLLAERDLTEAQAEHVEGFRVEYRAGRMDKSAASTLIGWLLSIPRRTARPAYAAEDARSTAGPAPEGMHKLDGEIYKVQVAVHGSGQTYAKKLVVSDQGCRFGCGHGQCGHSPEGQYTVRFVYAAGVIRRLSTDTLLPRDEAAAFGQLYGCCCVCGRTLTDEDSIAAGIGPICAAKFDR